MHEWPADASGPRLLFSCHVSNAAASPSLAHDRGLFARVSGERPSGAAGPLPQVLNTYRLELQKEWYESSAVQYGTSGGTAAASRTEQRSYIVTQVRGGGEVAEFADQLSKHFGVPLVPWGAVAADVTAARTRQGGLQQEGEQQQEQLPPLEDGRAFCFLPLPAKTGLPVHVNGYFELSSNRRDIWWVLCYVLVVPRLRDSERHRTERVARGRLLCVLTKDVSTQLQL